MSLSCGASGIVINKILYFFCSILKIYKFENTLVTFKGEFLKGVGCDTPSDGPLWFNNPKGITVHSNTGQIFIADANNHRIQVFNIDLFYCYSFGSAPEPFHCPYDLAFDIEEYLYVVDYICTL